MSLRDYERGSEVWTGEKWVHYSDSCLEDIKKMWLGEVFGNANIQKGEI